MPKEIPDHLVRVREDQEVVTVVVIELGGSHVTLSPGRAFNADHPVVSQCPWAFYDDVETATAEPGAKRTVSRAPAKKKAATQSDD